MLAPVVSAPDRQSPVPVQKNLLYADVLRCLGTFAVVVIHSSYQLFYQAKTMSPDRWLAVNFWESCSRWAVPVFFMLSGLLLLNPARPLTIKNILLKRVPRLLVPLLLWSEIYLLWINRQNIVDRQPFSFIEGLKWMYSREVFLHLWFIYALLGIYLALPLLRLIANYADRKTRLYSIVIWFLFNGILGFIEERYKVPIGIKMPMFNIYVGYFLLGFWISESHFTRRHYMLVCLAGLLSLLAIFFGTYAYSMSDDKSYMAEYFYGYSSFTVITLSASLFCLAAKVNWNALLQRSEWLIRAIQATSSLSFGIYLSHLLLIEIFWNGFFFEPITADLLHPLIGIPLFSSMVFALAWLLAKALRAIPGLRWLAP